MKNTKTILFMAVIIMFIAACDKTPYHPFDQDAKEFFIFKKGSWWKYENDQTHEIDCLYIADQNYSLKILHDFNKYYFDLSVTNYVSKDSVFHGDGYYNSSSNDYTTINEIIYYKNISLGFYFSFPDPAYENDYSYIRDGISVSGHSKITYNGDNIYSEDNKTMSENDTIFYTELLKIWRERMKGMVKFYIKNDTSEFTLNLIDYKIVY